MNKFGLMWKSAVLVLPYILIHVICACVLVYHKCVLCFYAEAVAYIRSVFVFSHFNVIFGLVMSKHWAICRPVLHENMNAVYSRPLVYRITQHNEPNPMKYIHMMS